MIHIIDGTKTTVGPDLSERINELGAKVAFERPLFGITMFTAPLSILQEGQNV